ncbi:hypothetical protein CsSME_00012403 [Camellia sinensis var. sinensis]
MFRSVVLFCTSLFGFPCLVRIWMLLILIISIIYTVCSTFQSEESLPLISRPDGLGKLQSVEGMTIQKSFELMDNVKPIQNVVKALATNDELRNAFLNVKEVQELKQRLKTGDND